MGEKRSFEETNAMIEHGIKENGCLSYSLSMLAIMLGIVGLVMLLFVPLLGIVLFIGAILLLIVGIKSSKQNPKGIRTGKSFNHDNAIASLKSSSDKLPRFDFKFPETDGHGHALLTVYDMNVTGVLHEHDAIDPQKLILALYENERLVLKTDPNNRNDKNAVKVLNVDGAQIGWLPKGESLQIDIANRLNEGQTVYARVNHGYVLDKHPGKAGLIIDVARYSKR